MIFQVILVSALSDTLWGGFDLRPMAAFARETGRPTGWFGGYHGQLNYLGRIRSVAELMEEQDRSELRLSDEQVEEMKRRLADPDPKFLTLEEVRQRFAHRRV